MNTSHTCNAHFHFLEVTNHIVFLTSTMKFRGELIFAKIVTGLRTRRNTIPAKISAHTILATIEESGAYLAQHSFLHYNKLNRIAKLWYKKLARSCSSYYSEPPSWVVTSVLHFNTHFVPAAVVHFVRTVSVCKSSKVPYSSSRAATHIVVKR